MVHPCVVMTNKESSFIPNDLTLDNKADQSLLLVTGPNMGGKSTLLRSTALCAILAQIGCFVPAQSCELTPIDRIFTRIGASDRILEGKSTYLLCGNGRNPKCSQVCNEQISSYSRWARQRYIYFWWLCNREGCDELHGTQVQLHDSVFDSLSHAVARVPELPPASRTTAWPTKLIQVKVTESLSFSNLSKASVRSLLEWMWPARPSSHPQSRRKPRRNRTLSRLSLQKWPNEWKQRKTVKRT